MRLIQSFILLLFCSHAFAQTDRYTFVFLNSRTDKAELPKEEIDKLMEGHIANINRLAKEGKLIVAGPFDGGGGIFILNTTSVDEANVWLSTDPGIQANRWKIDILPYQPRMGGVCAAEEPYEMVTYTFIRFRSNMHKETVGAYPEQLKKHDEYIKQLAKSVTIITEGIFDEQEGGILVMKGDLQPEIWENDPAVKGGTLLFDVKKLWVAKGAFCEK